MTEAPAPPEEDRGAVIVSAAGDEPPPWAAALGARIVPVEELGDGASGAAAVVRRAGAVLLDAASTRFVPIARRVHAIDAAVQVIAVAPPEATQAARRALLYAPGLGEIWVASPHEVDAALADRAAGVTAQRRRFERTRARIERERVTASPQRAERALISDAYLASLLRVLPDAVFSVDASGRVLSANAAAQRLFGTGGRDVTGSRLAELLQLAPPMGDDVAGLLQRAATEEPEVGFRTGTGEHRIGELRAATLDAQGVPVWAVVLRDVTAHHEALEQVRDFAAELEASSEELQATTEELASRTEEAERAADALRESESSFRALVDAIPTLAWAARPDGYIDWYNRRWYEYTGTTPEQMQGWGWQSVHDPAVLPEVVRRWRLAIETGARFEMTFPIRAADGTFRAHLTRVVPLVDSDGTILRWFGTNTDVQAEHEARAAAEAARRHADEANLAKSQFLANMSHELRTPLNAIAGHIELLDMELHGPVTGTQREALSRVKRAQEHLLGLINDILNFAKLETGRVEYAMAPLRVDALIADVAPLMEPQFGARGLAFTCEPLPPGIPLACGDRDKVRQVLLNLLSNAAKFTPRGGAVRIGARRHDTAHVAIAVTDTGPGIPPDRRESIFEPFVQLRPQWDATSEGTGLGLAISRDLARGMGGDLFVDPVPDGGSEFVFVLPIASEL